MKQKFLAAKVALAVTLMAGSITTMSPAQAGIPVIDGGNLVQNVMTAIESVAQTLKQIEQYQTQLQQYENMIQNTVAPAAYIWDQAQSTINGLMNAVDTLNYYKTQLGSVDSYLGKFQDVAYYRSSPCFNGTGGCTPAEQAAMAENRRLASESQKKANDALFKGLDRQQDALKSASPWNWSRTWRASSCPASVSSSPLPLRRVSSVPKNASSSPIWRLMRD